MTRYACNFVPCIKHILKQSMKIVTVSVHWKWDSLVTYSHPPTMYLNRRVFVMKTSWTSWTSKILSSYRICIRGWVVRVTSSKSSLSSYLVWSAPRTYFHRDILKSIKLSVIQEWYNLIFWNCICLDFIKYTLIVFSDTLGPNLGH